MGWVHLGLFCREGAVFLTASRHYVTEVLDATAPFQCALSTRAGTDALAHAVRFLAESDPNLVLVCLDGVGAFEYFWRARLP